MTLPKQLRGDRPPFMADLTQWFGWHRRAGTLPAKWAGAGLAEISRTVGSVPWLVCRPWRSAMPGVEVVTVERAGERETRVLTSRGTLISRWSLGPDGDWWQVAYPATAAEQLPAALEAIRARTYEMDTTRLEELRPAAGEDGILALELPRRPYSDLFHDYLGWSEGLMLLYEQGEIIQEMLGLLEAKLQALAEQVAALPAQVVLAPDNLDGQFTSPRAFRQYLSASYRRTADILHQHGKQLWVHVGGPAGRLVGPLAEAGVDAVEGVAGPPQGDLTLDETRKVAGRDLILWGGIPQDALLDTLDQAAFEAAVAEAVEGARDDPAAIIGVADRVPVQADLGRLEALAALIRS